MIKLSIIIPVYNVELYIEKCLTSIINQTLKGIEVIAVDDGSTDSSPAILDDFCLRYPEIIKVIHKKNEDVSIARNVGIDNATGEYIAFVDSDDFINEDMYQKMYDYAKKYECDLVCCDATAIYPDRNIIISSGIVENELKSIYISGYPVVWNKIFHKELIGNIRFKPSVRYEDVHFLYKIYPFVKKTGVINKPMYNYLQRENSITYTYNERLYELLYNFDDLLNYYKKNDFYNAYKDELEYSYIRYYLATFVKRLAKTKNKKEFDKGVKYVIYNVNKNFPRYKKNIYLKKNTYKSIYLKNFNVVISKIVFFLEKNKLN